MNWPLAQTGMGDIISIVSFQVVEGHLGGRYGTMLPADKEFAELLDHSKQGDHAALSVLLRREGHLLSGYVRRRLDRDLRAHTAVEDILQEVYLTALRTVGQLHGRTPATFRSWLTGIAVNKVREARRAQQTKKRGAGHRRIEVDRTTLYGKLVERVAHSDPTPSRCVAAQGGRTASDPGPGNASAGRPSDHRTAIPAVASVRDGGPAHGVDGGSGEEARPARVAAPARNDGRRSTAIQAAVTARDAPTR